MSEEKLLKEECFSWTLDIAIITITTFRNEKFYTCCDEPYLDITFNITMRRKTLFYTVSYRHSHYHYHHHHHHHHHHRHHHRQHCENSGEPDHPLHGNLLPHSAHLLLAVGQRGEGGDRNLRHQHCFRHHYHRHHCYRHHIYQKGGCSNILYYKVLLHNTYVL